MSLEALLEDADRAAALSVAEMAGRIPTIERIARDLADVIDTAAWPCPPADEAALTRVCGLLGEVTARLDKAEGRPDIVLRVSLFGGVHALPPASSPMGYRMRADAQQIDWKTFADSALGRVFRQTRSGRLVARVEQLEASALRILRLPCVADARLREKSLDVRRQGELQVFNLRRIRDALAVALGEADAVRRNPHPLKHLFLVAALEEADETLRRVDYVLRQERARPQAQA